LEILKTYLSFRTKQFLRFIHSIGIGYIVILVALLSGVLFQGLSNISALHDIGIFAGIAILLLVIFAQRNDTQFLRSTDMNLSYVFIIDALLVGIPISIILFLMSRFSAALGVLALCVVIPILSAQFATPFKISNTLFLNDIDLPFLKVLFYFEKSTTHVDTILCIWNLLFSTSLVFVYIGILFSMRHVSLYCI